MIVFFDIDTQIDFMFPAGALYVPGAENILPAVSRLNRHAAARGHRVISSMCAHRENDKEFRQWPAHCVSGTTGQRKPAVTLLEHGQQVLLEKQELDLFSNPDLPRLLSGVDAAVVYGVVTEYCVKCAAMGLLDKQIRVQLVTDAIQTLKRKDSEAFIADFTGRGGALTTVNSVCSQT